LTASGQELAEIHKLVKDLTSVSRILTLGGNRLDGSYIWYSPGSEYSEYGITVNDAV